MIGRLSRLWRGVRVRITAVAVASVALVLSVAGVALLRVQETQLLDNLDATLGQRADALQSAQLDLADRPVTLENLAGDDAVVQILDVRGDVIAASLNATDAEPIGPVTIDRQITRTVDSLPVEDDRYRVLSRPIAIDAEAATVHVATNTDDVRGVLAQLRVALLAVIPLAAAVIGVLVWLLVGRTLRPVEAIRRRVAVIDGTELSARVPTPGTDDEIDRLAHTMNDMLARQERATRRQQQFLADASHELRTPIARLRTEIDTTDVAVARGLSDDVDHLGALVDDLLHLARSDARADAGSGEVRVRPVDLDDIVLDEIRTLRPRTGHSIDASKVSAAHLMGDAGQLRRLVRNLLDNAARHAHTTISIALVEDEGGSVQLRVIDDGDGIAASEPDQIFERFVRLDAARDRDRGGTGLGLAIARDIVTRHGGTISVDAERPAGTEFIVTIPPDRARSH